MAKAKKTKPRRRQRNSTGLTLGELLHGVLNSQYASIFPEGLFDLPIEMPDGLPVTSLYVEDGVITVTDNELEGEF